MATLLEDIIQVLKNLGGVAHLSKIQDGIARIRKGKLKPSWKYQIQENLYRNSEDSVYGRGKYGSGKNIFYSAEGKRKGVWGLGTGPGKGKNYWWVNQRGIYFREEMKLSCIWAPKKNKKGGRNFHWDNLTRIKPGDIVFSYHNKKIVAVSVVKSKAFNSKRPDSFPSRRAYPERRRRTGQSWSINGRKVLVKYQLLDNPIDIKKILSTIGPHLKYRHSPYSTKHKRGNLGYLFYLNEKAAEILRQAINNKAIVSVDQQISEAEEEDSYVGKTDKISKQKIRIKQGEFRDKVFSLWKNKCCITNFKEKDPSVLIAAHIWPYMHCKDNKEKIDKYNGLPLTPGYDKAFDRGYISFLNNGRIIKSKTKKISAKELKKLGISLSDKINGLKENHRKYLSKHRKLHGFSS